MGLLGKIKGEFVDIIEWLDPTNNTLVHRFERYKNQIKNGAKLTVRESQVAVFINEGQLADVFEPGMYSLTTENLPILSTLKGWKYGFNSPFLAEVYFINTKNFTDQKWGTPNPIMLRDPEFGPIRIRAFGNYQFRVKDPVKFIRDVVGTDGNFTTEGITEQLRNIVLSRFTDAIAESKIPVLDMASNYDEVSKFCHDKMVPEFEEYGLSLTKLLISNISLPQNVEEALDKRSSMGIIGDMGKFQQYQTGQAIGDMGKAGGDGSGMAAGGMGMGMGMAMGSAMMGSMGQAQQPQQHSPQAPPPMPAQSMYYVAAGGQQTGPFDLNTIKGMIAQKTFTKESMVWKEGMSGWMQAGQVGELISVFGAVPPPPPPPPPMPGQ
ncbi:MAG: antifreeze protein [Bacteroidetes bacterium GWF2_38_335]|nr:MAG: antifreeze protein [Bacteroidetes bacterium GWF2_38_335]OFY80117.1 MAG: antifreeze protein [Bacteroidetes bacterium RIFOXYA12_FULL_38_20]HBS88556.1 antifreeze protein [Bacteroidales bacterium]